MTVLIGRPVAVGERASRPPLQTQRRRREGMRRGMGGESPGGLLRTNTASVLVREAEYAAIQALLEGEERRQELHAGALRNAVGRMHEGL